MRGAGRHGSRRAGRLATWRAPCGSKKAARSAAAAPRCERPHGPGTSCAGQEGVPLHTSPAVRKPAASMTVTSASLGSSSGFLTGSKRALAAAPRQQTHDGRSDCLSLRGRRCAHTQMPSFPPQKACFWRRTHPGSRAGRPRPQTRPPRGALAAPAALARPWRTRCGPALVRLVSRRPRTQA